MEGFENRDEYQSQSDYYSYGQNEDINTYTEGTHGAEDGMYRPYEEPVRQKRHS